MSRQCRNLVAEVLVCQYYCYEPTISKSIGILLLCSIPGPDVSCILTAPVQTSLADDDRPRFGRGVLR